MNLNELDNKNVAKKALKESFGYRFDPSNLTRLQTSQMLQKVRGLINESRRSPDYHKNQRNPTHMKLVFVEQSLSAHLKNAPNPRIVFENEEVEKSQASSSSGGCDGWPAAAGAWLRASPLFDLMLQEIAQPLPPDDAVNIKRVILGDDFLAPLQKRMRCQ